MSVELLFLCTGNICRSPMAEAFARELLNETDVNVGSAGRLFSGGPGTEEMIEVMASRGLDLSDHKSRVLTADDNPDVLIGMAREHIRHAVETNPDLLERSVTLKELVRRARQAGPRSSSQEVTEYVGTLIRDRPYSDLVGNSRKDDIADPIGGSHDEYEKCASQIQSLVEEMVTLLWPDMSDD